MEVSLRAGESLLRLSGLAPGFAVSQGSRNGKLNLSAPPREADRDQAQPVLRTIDTSSGDRMFPW